MISGDDWRTRVTMKVRRPSGPWIASIAVNALIIALFMQALVAHDSMFDFFGLNRRTPAPVVERVGFLSLPQAKTPEPTIAGRSGGNGRTGPVRHVIPLVPPTRIPTAIRPQKPGTPAVSGEPSSGPLIGGGGPLRGVQPRYGDPRLWTAPGEIAVAPKTPAERLDSVITNDIRAHNDSIRVATGNQRAPGDWTFEKGGRKYGIDSKYIRLGPVSIPTAVLALLPLNITGNPTTYERNKTLTANHDEIFEQAQRGINDADFQKAVRSIRERKERERKEAEQIKQKAAAEAASGPD